MKNSGIGNDSLLSRVARSHQDSKKKKNNLPAQQQLKI